ncbi:MAG: hypothetical protein GY793_02390 [Proteobacteria bacterium]|nr:hypothetical protein [Desulfobacterales bacterium]MCP4161368.1 hypothetical protein [Deltaproteobacteria bacterium]MCP4354484.1 hypothetical protein [Pseudomonadota bacterium]
MGAWDVNPWDNDSAADWFSLAFEGMSIDSKIERALKYKHDNYDEVRAAAYLLEVLGISYIWPGELDKLDGHIKKALEILKAMIDTNSDDKDMDFLELWDNDPEIISSVEKQIGRLEILLNSNPDY